MYNTLTFILHLRSQQIEVGSARARQVRKSPHLELARSLAPVVQNFATGRRLLRSVVVELLGLEVQRAALLDRAEALDLEYGTGLPNCRDPWALLAEGTLLLAHDLAKLVLGQILCGQATNGLRLGAPM